MTTAAWILLGLTGAFALADWALVWTERPDAPPRARWITKPGTLALLVATAVVLDPCDPTIRAWMVAGLVLSLIGDIALLGPDRWFVVGLGSFLLGHVAYVIAMGQGNESVALTMVGLLVVAVAVSVVGRRIVAAVRAADRSMIGPVVAYLTVISAMVITAFGTAGAFAIAGALLFYASDATLAWNRFVVPLRHGHIAVMTTYHLGQVGLVLWLVQA